MCFIALSLLEYFFQTQNLLKLVVMCGTCNLSSPSSKHSSSSPSTLTYNPAILFTSQVKPVDFGNFGHFGHFGHFEHFGHL